MYIVTYAPQYSIVWLTRYPRQNFKAGIITDGDDTKESSICRSILTRAKEQSSWQWIMRNTMAVLFYLMWPAAINAGRLSAQAQNKKKICIMCLAGFSLTTALTVSSNFSDVLNSYFMSLFVCVWVSVRVHTQVFQFLSVTSHRITTTASLP